MNKLHVCEKCGNNFSKIVGIINISKCPRCKEIDFDMTTPKTEFEDDGEYLNEEG